MIRKPLLAAAFCIGILTAVVDPVVAQTSNANIPHDPAPAPANSRTLTIQVPAEGEHFVRLIPSDDAKEAAPLPERFTDKKFTVTIDPSKLGKAPRLAIDDAKTGATAVMPLPTASNLELRRADFALD